MSFTWHGRFALAQRGRSPLTRTNVGCVIVNNGDIVGEGYHHRAGAACRDPVMRCGWRAQSQRNRCSRLNLLSHHGRERRHVVMR